MPVLMLMQVQVLVLMLMVLNRTSSVSCEEAGFLAHLQKIRSEGKDVKNFSRWQCGEFKKKII